MSVDPNLAPAEDGRSWFTLPRFAVLLGTLVIFSFWDVLVGMGTFVLGDFDVFGYPLAYHFRESLLQGELPLWNPLNNFGLPFLAQWNTMVLYPPSLMHLALPLSWSLGLFCVQHLFVGGLGMFQLARRWTDSGAAGAVAGVAYAFGGLSQSSLMWPNNSAALGLLPWVMLLTETGCRAGGRALLIAVLVGSLQMLAGAPEIILFTWLLVALRLAISDRQFAPSGLAWRRFAMIVGLISLLCAVQLLPFFDLLLHSQRHVAGENTWAASPSVWGNYFVPLFRTLQTSAGTFYQADQFWVVSSYAGIGTLLLACVALLRNRGRAVWLLAIVGAVGLILAMGENGLLYSLIGKLLPLGLMRYPAKFLVIVAVVLPLLAAFGVKALLDERTRSRDLIPGLVIMLAGWALTMILIGTMPIEGEDSGLALVNGWTRLACLLAVGGIFFCLKIGPPRNRRWLTLAVVLVLWLDLQTQQPALTPRIDRANYDGEISHLREAGPLPLAGRGRVMLTAYALMDLKGKTLPDLGQTTVLHRLSLFDNLNLREGVAKVDGLYSLYLREEQEVEMRLYAGPSELRKPLADFAGITHQSSPTNIFQWLRRPSAMPLISGGQIPEYVDSTATLLALENEGFQPARQVYLEPGVAASVGEVGTNVAISDIAITAHRVAFTVNAERNALVVIAQAHYHPWKAVVNGQPMPILRANHAFQAIRVPGGSSKVSLEYHDTAFRLGAGISLLSLVGLMMAFRRSPVAADCPTPKNLFEKLVNPAN